MGLRAKFILAVVVVIAVGFGGAGLLTAHQTERLLLRQVQIRGAALLSAMTPTCVNAMANGEFEVVDSFLGRVSQGKQATLLGVRHIMVLDHEGRIYAHSDPTIFGFAPADPFYRHATQARTITSRRLSEAGRGSLVEVATPLASGVRWGTLVAAFTLDLEEAALSIARQRILWWTLILSLLCGLLLYLALTFAVLRPVRRLTMVTRAFAAGNLDKRLRATGTDELAHLGVHFDRMADQLQVHTTDLEQQVQDRAAEIVQKNEALVELNARLVDAVNRLEELAITDELTGLYNRRKFKEALEFEIQRNERTAHPFSLMMIDVDQFKHYNDTNGHPAGDEVLRGLAQLMFANLRVIDVLARFGGEEFVVLLLDTEMPGARIAAAKLREKVAEAAFANQAAQPTGNLTISIGVASFPEHGRTAAEIIAAADRALYQAKAAGRDRVVVAAEGGTA